MSAMQHASKSTELSRFVSDFVASERMKMRRFEEGLAFLHLKSIGRSSNLNLLRVV